MKKYSIIFTSFFYLILLSIIPYTAYSVEIKVQPKRINLGDTVDIQVLDIDNNRSSVIKVISPGLDKYTYSLRSRNRIKFGKTYSRGFLSSNWNKYKIHLLNDSIVLDSAFFYLRPSNKTLYFTVYVDDIGKAGFIDSYDYQWFSEIGGKINIAYQNDDWGNKSLEEVIQKYPEDFIFHHFHSYEYTGPKFAYYIYHFVNWYKIKKWIENNFGFRPRDRYFAILLLILSVFSVILYFKNRKFKLYIIFVPLITIIWFLLWYSAYLMKNPENKSINFSDNHWNKNFLLNIKNEFRLNNRQYPSITRHGWNTPPRGLNKFYTTRMNVLADASLNYPYISDDYYINKDFGKILNIVTEYRYDWPQNINLPIPYYTNIEGEINHLWNGIESYRGLIEIPITTSNYCNRDTLLNKEKNIIDSLPHGALVSIWGHPSDNLKNIKCLINYIKGKYNINYIYADDYLKIFMSHNPRPVLVKNNEVYWAYFGDKMIVPIRKTNLVRIEKGRIVFETEKLPPYILLDSSMDSVHLENYNCINKKHSYNIYRLISH